MKKKKCLRCGHEWVARIDKPRYCPGCRSIYWDVARIQERRMRKCAVCGDDKESSEYYSSDKIGTICKDCLKDRSAYDPVIYDNEGY